jgi:hypothetical protein
MGIDARLPLPTTAGWLPAGQLQAGDEVFSFSGYPVKVVSIQKYTPAACYKIWLKDGLTLVVDARTGIPVYDRKARNQLHAWTRTTYRHEDSFVRPLGPETILTWEFGRCRIPVCQPLRPPHRNLPVDPYELARWMFERSAKRKSNRTDITRELIERYPTIPTHIPEEYLFASFEQRLAFLRGILSVRKAFRKDSCMFKVQAYDYILARQIQGLVESFGIKSHIVRVRAYHQYKVCFKTIIRLCEDQLVPKRIHELEYRQIMKLEKVQPRECVYIKTDDPNNTILVSEGYLGVSL